MPDAVQVEGLAELRRDLRKLGDTATLIELRGGLKEAARIVADDARRRVPQLSGKAASSIRPGASGNKAYVAGGKKAVPYYGWLDFGGRRAITGNSRSQGPWAGSGKGPSEGRFIYPALVAKEREIVDAVSDAMSKAIIRRGLG